MKVTAYVLKPVPVEYEWKNGDEVLAMEEGEERDSEINELVYQIAAREWADYYDVVRVDTDNGEYLIYEG